LLFRAGSAPKHAPASTTTSNTPISFDIVVPQTTHRPEPANFDRIRGVGGGIETQKLIHHRDAEAAESKALNDLSKDGGTRQRSLLTDLMFFSVSPVTLWCAVLVSRLKSSFTTETQRPRRAKL
jgi:hypothetical protein